MQYASHLCGAHLSGGTIGATTASAAETRFRFSDSSSPASCRASTSFLKSKARARMAGIRA